MSKTPLLFTPLQAHQQRDIELGVKEVKTNFWKSFSQEICNLIITIDEVNLKFFSCNLFTHKMKIDFNMLS